MYYLALLFFVLRGVFDFTVLPVRAVDSQASEDKALAETILEKVGSEPLYLYRDVGKLGIAVPFYITRARSKIVPREDQVNLSTYIIGQPSWLSAAHGQTIYSFSSKGTRFLLVKA